MAVDQVIALSDYSILSTSLLFKRDYEVTLLTIGWVVTFSWEPQDRAFTHTWLDLDLFANHLGKF